MSERLAPFSGAGWSHANAAHLFRRAGFGATPGQVEVALERGLAATVDELVDATPAEHDSRVRQGVHSLLATGELEPLQAWWISLMASGTAPLVERMTLVWHDLFATSNAKVDDVRMMHAQNELFREHALGNFRALVHGVAKDPAMLVWLDGDANVAGAPNENFAREVMELFCLGIGHYTEGDIQELARAFTGQGTDGRRFADRTELHDHGVKTIFGKSGRFRGEEAVDLVLDHPACPRHVARRLLASFVHPEPTNEEVEELAAVLTDSSWSLRETLRVLLRSRLFFSDRARRSRIAGPVEVLLTSVRALGARVSPKVLARAAEECGQALFRPPSVKGWDGGASWIQASTWLARHNRLAQLARAHGKDDGPARVDLERAFGAPARADVAETVTDVLLPDGADPELRRALERAAEESPDVDAALVNVCVGVLTSPEYHLS